MRLLIFTQKVDKKDSVLGFFHSWIVAISKEFESVEVICLEKGEFDLPKNVTVYSLGKETKISKLGYVKNLYKYLNLISGSYDKVFVHMNQEYILLAGLYWKMKNIPVYLWRNHPHGSILTRVAVLLSKKVFCTSAHSFTARFKKTVIMPAGIDTNLFKSVDGTVKKKYSICMVGRISPIKHHELALEAVNILVSKGAQVSLSIIGSVLDNFEYYEKLKKYIADHNLSNIVRFEDAVSVDKVPEVYSGHEICLNLTESGSFDKTVIESSACGSMPLVSNESFQGLLPDICITSNIPVNIAESVQRLLDPQNQLKIQGDLKKFVESQSLSFLVSKLVKEIQ